MKASGRNQQTGQTTHTLIGPLWANIYFVDRSIFFKLLKARNRCKEVISQVIFFVTKVVEA